MMPRGFFASAAEHKVATGVKRFREIAHGPQVLCYSKDAGPGLPAASEARMPTRCQEHCPSAPSTLSMHWVMEREACMSIRMCCGPSAAVDTVRQSQPGTDGGGGLGNGGAACRVRRAGCAVRRSRSWQRHDPRWSARASSRLGGNGRCRVAPPSRRRAAPAPAAAPGFAWRTEVGRWARRWVRWPGTRCRPCLRTARALADRPRAACRLAVWESVRPSNLACGFANSKF